MDEQLIKDLHQLLEKHFKMQKNPDLSIYVKKDVKDMGISVVGSDNDTESVILTLGVFEKTNIFPGHDQQSNVLKISIKDDPQSNLKFSGFSDAYLEEAKVLGLLKFLGKIDNALRIENPLEKEL